MAVVTIVMGMQLVAGCSDIRASGPVGRANESSPVPPPAMSAADRTVFVTWTLEDSFDILPGGTCAGRSTNRGMRDRSRVLLTGKATGLSDETVASASYTQTPPRIYHGKPMRDDDYRYCVITAVWSPAVPDADGYTYKFPGSAQTEDLPRLGLTPYGRPEMPGFGRIQISVQTCRSALDPPEKACPEIVG